MYDLCVIGSGWAGFNASLRAAELGAKVALIESDEIGGTCLNRGCIPTKTLVNSCRLIKEISHYQNFGIEVKDFSVSFERIQERKKEVIIGLQKGITFQLNKQKVEIIQGTAKITGPNQIEVNGNKLEAKFIIIATGSRPAELPSLKFNQNNIISSNEILELTAAPKSLLIIGGGAIGCEFASIFSVLGTAVTIVEALDNLLPGEDKEISQKIETVFKKSGIKVFTKSKAESFKPKDFEKTLVCVGRAFNTENIWSDNLSIQKDRNRIVVNRFLQTAVENIYAVGDCIGGKLLAHVAAYEGSLAAENIFWKKIPVDYTAIPSCTFTNPEVASVGLNEQAAIAGGKEVKTSKFSFLASGMAHILEETDGFIKLVADKNTDDLLGASIIGPKATEMISSLTLAIRNRLKSKDIYGTVFAHPSLSEGIFEAAKNLSQPKDN